MRLQSLFSTLRRRGETALMPYLMAGFPTLPDSVEAAARISEAGADLLEIGVPFSDPIADGPTIQAASRRALGEGADLGRILDAFSGCTARAPRVLMSYVNPLLAYGRDRLLDDLQEAGFCGLIVPDVPLEEAEAWRTEAEHRGFGWVPLIAPTSGGDRAAEIASGAIGFAYYISVTGITGVRSRLPERLTVDLDALRARTRTPIAVGFGVSDATQVRALAPHCDGIVVGSRLVEALRDGEPITPLIRELKQATKEPTPC